MLYRAQSANPATIIDTYIYSFTIIHFMTTTPLIVGLAFAVSVGTSAGPVETATWVPQPGDSVMVDTQQNVGYLIREDGTHTTFPVLTGQRRVVRYIGRTYNAATPNKAWTAKSIDVKGRSMTFGETGTFVRLYDEDGEQTPYGIHSHLTFQKMLDEGDRFRSMGCVLVSEDVLKLIVQTFELNGGTLNVTTAANIELPEPRADIATKPAWLGF